MFDTPEVPEEKLAPEKLAPVVPMLPLPCALWPEVVPCCL